MMDLSAGTTAKPWTNYRVNSSSAISAVIYPPKLTVTSATWDTSDITVWAADSTTTNAVTGSSWITDNMWETKFSIDNDYTITFNNRGTEHGHIINMGGVEWSENEPRRKGLSVTDGPEAKARVLLKRLIGDTQFRNYLKHGFVTYRGKSGKTYQVFPGHEMTRVWENGKAMEKLCVIFSDGKIPPTDSVVMRLLLLENSEDEFKRLSNVLGFHSDRRHREPQVVETGRILKLAERKARGEIMVDGSRIIVAA